MLVLVPAGARVKVAGIGVAGTGIQLGRRQQKVQRRRKADGGRATAEVGPAGIIAAGATVREKNI